MWNKKHKYYIGVDTGVKTGFAVWDKERKIFAEISTLMIHRAMDKILEYHRSGHDIHVFVEDARKATFGRQLDYAKAQGSGSVKRDAKIWEDFLTDHRIPFTMVRPKKAITKLDKETFQKITGYTGITSSHGRDSAMIVYGM